MAYVSTHRNCMARRRREYLRLLQSRQDYLVNPIRALRNRIDERRKLDLGITFRQLGNSVRRGTDSSLRLCSNDSRIAILDKYQPSLRCNRQ